MQQRQASPHTISSYRDTFRLLLMFAQQRLHTSPSQLMFAAIDAPFELPTHAAQIQRVLAIPSKRFTRTQVHFITRPEVESLLAAPDQRTWFGRRDHAFLLVAAQTGLRLSEMTGLTRGDVTLGTGAHVHVIGKGRKERCVPLAKPTVAVLKRWLCEPARGDGQVLFPNARGSHLSPDGVHYLLVKHSTAAAKVCPSLKDKRVTVHVLRVTPWPSTYCKRAWTALSSPCGSGTNP
jgi:site-specific recombinase XerD